MTDSHSSQQLLDDLKNVLRQAEDLLQTTADAPGKKLEAARRKLENGIAAVRSTQARLQDRMSDAFQASGRFVKEHPYETAGGGLALLLAAVAVVWLLQRSR